MLNAFFVACGIRQCIHIYVQVLIVDRIHELMDNCLIGYYNNWRIPDKNCKF